MDFSTAQYAQLIGALAFALIVFMAAYLVPSRYVIPPLIATLPFQPVSSAYGTLNMVIIYLAAAAYLFRGRFKEWPMLLPSVIILFSLVISTTQAMRPTYRDHILYIVGFFSNFLIFYLAYNYVRIEKVSVRGVFKILAAASALVSAYCLLNLVSGYNRISVLGIDEFTFMLNDESQRRLIGPFNSAGVNGCFFVFQILIFLYATFHSRTRFGWLVAWAMVLVNFGLLVGTGSRGSFLVALGGAGLFVLLMSRRVGVMKMARVAMVSSVAFIATASVMIVMTDFNVLFTRLSETKFEGAIPETRAKPFAAAMERIEDGLILGHGPRIRLIRESDRRIRGYESMHFPHSLYLALLYTGGLLGLFAFLGYFMALMTRWLSVRHNNAKDDMLSGIPTLAIILLVVFMVDELKIEFTRAMLLDFQNYVFALWGLLLGLTEGLRVRQVAPQLVQRARTMQTASALAATAADQLPAEGQGMIADLPRHGQPVNERKTSATGN